MYSIVGADGREYGPVEKEALLQWAREGRVTATTTVIDQATGQRFAASQMAELNAILNPGLAAGAGAYTPPPGPQADRPYGTPYTSPYSAQTGGYSPYSSMPSGPPAGFPNLTNQLLASIGATICCGCLPLGVISIVYSAMAMGKQGRGDYMGAMDDAGKAKMWAWISFGVGIVLGTLNIIRVVLTASHRSAYGGF